MMAALAFAALVWVGLPLAAPIFWAALAGLWCSGNDVYIAAEALYRGLDNLPLAAIVGFVLAGGLMGPAGLTEELVACASRLLGRAPGGLAMVTILACLFFSCLSGSGGATCAAVGAIMVPAMLAEGYPRAYAGAMAATGGVLGIFIPPSIPMIIYAAQANIPADRLFLAGVLPGLMLTMLLMFTAWLDARRRRLAIAALPPTLLGGIWGGLFTPTEASVVAVLWGLLVGLARRRLTAANVWAVLTDTALLTGGAVVLLAPATALARYLAVIGAPQKLALWVAAVAGGPTAFLFVMAAVLFFCGLFADTISMIAIMTPIFLPTAALLGADPVVMGLVFILCCEAGFLTPPFGGNLFIAARIADVDLGSLSVAALPYVAVIMLFTAFLILCPSVATLVL